MKFIRKITPLIVCLLATACNVSNASKKAPTKGEYTVLVYMCGANLESDYANQTIIHSGGQTYRWNGMGLATMDINEILSVKSKPKDVNVVIETGGANKWTSSKYGKYGSYDIDAKKLQIHHVNNKNKLELDKTLQYKSMGRPSTLQAFLEYGLTEYPAEKTALILWNHGGGLQGVCFDEKTNDGLTATEVTRAVDAALKTCDMEGQKLEWIGYDACLMAVQDIAELNSHYFNYMVSSQQLEAGEGWEYFSWVDDLYAKKSTPEILEQICDSFIAYNDAYGPEYNDQTLAYYDLSKAPEYLSAWNDMTDQLNCCMSTYTKNAFRSLMNSCHAFGDDAAYAYGLVDIKDFLDKLSAHSTFASSLDLTRMYAALDDLIPYAKIGGGAGSACGLSMYWTISDYTSYFNQYDYSVTNFDSWVDFIENYGVIY